MRFSPGTTGANDASAPLHRQRTPPGLDPAVAIELIVVVLGVFIGLQASNWNQDCEQDRRSAEFMQRLKADLRAEAWNIEMQIGYHQQVQANAQRAVDALTGKAALSDEALLVAAYRATQYNDNVRQRARKREAVKKSRAAA